MHAFHITALLRLCVYVHACIVCCNFSVHVAKGEGWKEIDKNEDTIIYRQDDDHCKRK